jgi:hypothetical protein
MNLRYKAGRHLKFNRHVTFGYGLVNWLKLLYQNKFKIDVTAIPKVVWITLGILSTHIFRIYEHIRYAKEINKVVVKDPIFIVGYPRSGTTFLHYLLTRDTQFCYCATYQVLMPNIFLSLGKSIEKILGFFLPKTRLIDNLKMGVLLPKEEEFAMAAISDASMINGFYFPENINTYFRRYVLFQEDEKYEKEWKEKLLFFLKKVSLRQQNKRLIIKSPFNTGRIKQILELFPDAKFIHIHRNPYEVYYSNEKLYETLLPIFSFHKIENNKIENFIIDSYKQSYQKYLKEISLIMPGNLTTISYQDFIGSPLNTLQKVYKDLKLDNFKDASPEIEFELRSYKNYQTNKHLMEEETKRKIYKEWFFFFETFGYSFDNKSFSQLKAV